MRKLIVVGLASVAVLIAGFYAYQWLDRKPSNKQIISGNIELTEVKIAFKMSGRLTELTVNEGDSVKKGMLIARLDNEQLLLQRQREQAALRTAQSLLEQLGTAIEYQRQTIEGEIQARIDLGQAMGRIQQTID